jgi:hypothetical protein
LLLIQPRLNINCLYNNPKNKSKEKEPLKKKMDGRGALYPNKVWIFYSES